LRETQTQLTEAEKMASLGNLVAGVAHEINTPVGVSVTAASHLVEQTRRFQSRIDDSQEVDVQELSGYQKAASACAELILKNLDRAAQLISSFKQVAVDQSSERQRQFELSTYLAEILTSLRPRIGRSGHQVKLDCPQGIFMHTFPGALYQVLSNLIINSLTHAFSGEQTGHIQITVVALGDRAIRLSFRDNGMGMSDEVRQHIFEPFFTTRRGSGGSGLGMHIVYNLVTQALGGTISCGEAPGGGALFEMELPRERAVSTEAEASDTV
jgi:C4-dicarboxylate-specific signal transduction histidine kinase